METRVRPPLPRGHDPKSLGRDALLRMTAIERASQVRGPLSHVLSGART